MPEAAELAPATQPAATPPAAPTRFVIPETPAAPAAAEGEDAQNTTEQAPVTPSEGEKPKDEVTPELAAKREGRRFERKLDKAYRERAEAQARAEILQRQIAELQKPKAPEGEPKLEQFDYDPEKYAQAKAEYAKTQVGKELEAKQRAEAGRAHQQRLVTSWEEKVERGEDKYDDFRQVVGELRPDSPFTAAIMEADNGDDIAHYLGKNPKEARRIAELPPLSQVREIGKLEAKLALEPVKPKTPSKAPAPIAPLSGNSPVETNEVKAEMPYTEFLKVREKQLKAAGRRR